MVDIGPTDRQLSAAERARLRRRRWIGRAVLLIAPLVVLATLAGYVAPAIDRADLVVAVAERGEVVGGFQAAGRLVPRGERVLAAPIAATMLAALVEPGDAVAAGQRLIELDLSEVELQLAKHRRALAVLDGKITQQRRAGQRSVAELEDQLTAHRLDLELALASLARADRLHQAGLEPAERLRAAEIAAERARLAVAGAERRLATAAETTSSELGDLLTERQIVAREEASSSDLLERSRMIAVDAGVVIEVLGEPGQAMVRGQTVVRLADLGAYEVEASAPASTSSRLRPTLPVRLRLDGGSFLDGRVGTVKPAVDAGAVHFDIVLDDPRHPELRPNRRVDAWVLLEHQADAVRLPARGLALSGRQVPMWVVEGDRAIRRELTLGASGPEWIEIVAGLVPGDQVVVSGIAPDSPSSLRLTTSSQP